jgi:serine/threonine-protein kinase PknG
MLEGDDVKLVDMGGVRRIDDPNGDIFGTKGYMPPELSDNPVEVSDLYTIGRSLATLIMDFNYQTTYEFSLPMPDEQPVLAQNEALYRFLLRATHKDVDA